MEKLTIVQSGGVLFIGVKEVEEHGSGEDSGEGFTVVQSGVTLLNPKMIMANPEERKLSLANCIGNPNTVNITGIINFQYQNEDADLALFYKYEVEGYPEEATKEPSKIIQFPQ